MQSIHCLFFKWWHLDEWVKLFVVELPSRLGQKIDEMAFQIEEGIKTAVMEAAGGGMHSEFRWIQS